MHITAEITTLTQNIIATPAAWESAGCWDLTKVDQAALQ